MLFFKTSKSACRHILMRNPYNCDHKLKYIFVSVELLQTPQIIVLHRQADMSSAVNVLILYGGGSLAICHTGTLSTYGHQTLPSTVQYLFFSN